MYCQPLYAAAEEGILDLIPNSELLRRTFRIPPLHIFGFQVIRSFQFNIMRLVFRTCFVVVTTGVPMLFPSLDDFEGTLGNYNFWFISVLLPVMMYIQLTGIQRWTQRWFLLHAFNGFCLLAWVYIVIGFWAWFKKTILLFIFHH